MDHEGKKEPLGGNDDDDNGDGNECHKRNARKKCLDEGIETFLSQNLPVASKMKFLREFISLGYDDKTRTKSARD